MFWNINLMQPLFIFMQLSPFLSNNLIPFSRCPGLCFVLFCSCFWMRLFFLCRLCMYVFFFCAHPHLLSCKALVAAVPVLGCFSPLSCFSFVFGHRLPSRCWFFFLVVICHHDTILGFLEVVSPSCFFFGCRLPS